VGEDAVTQLAIEPEVKYEITTIAAVPAVRGGIVIPPRAVRVAGACEPGTVVSAPAGSGKTMLLRSWVAEAG
jgi:hypothetical protein